MNAGILPEYEIDRERQQLPVADTAYSLQFQTITSCNARCVFCPHPLSWGQKPTGRMSFSTFERLLASMSPYTFYRVAPYLQNEPLLDPRLAEFIRLLREHLRFQEIEVSTNPGALTPKNAEKLISALSGTDHTVRISFHGTDRHTFERIMGIPFNRALRNTIAFLKDAESADIKVMIKSLGMARPPFRNAVDYFSESEFSAFWERICHEHQIQFQRIQLRYRSYHSRSDNIGRDLEAPPLIVRSSLRGFYCSRVDKWFHILYDGSLILCCNDYQRETVFGNIAEMNIADILRSEGHQKMAAQLRGSIESPSDFLCKRCASPGG